MKLCKIDLIPQITSLDNLYNAFMLSKKRKKNRRDIFNFQLNLLENLLSLQSDLQSGNYKPQPYNSFMIYEKKPRMIYAPSFRDLVAQRAVYEVIYPIIAKRLDLRCFGCVRGKGLAQARDYLAKCVTSKRKGYYLQIDIKKYFYSINHAILEEILRDYFSDEALIRILMKFCEAKKGVGIPLGSLIAQVYGLVYLSRLDFYARECLKISHFMRFVDDFIAFFDSEKEAKEALCQIQIYLYHTLKLRLSHAIIAPCFGGLSALGFHALPFKVLVSTSTYRSFSKALLKGDINVARSLLGQSYHTQSLKAQLAIAKRWLKRLA